MLVSEKRPPFRPGTLVLTEYDRNGQMLSCKHEDITSIPNFSEFDCTASSSRVWYRQAVLPDLVTDEPLFPAYRVLALPLQ